MPEPGDSDSVSQTEPFDTLPHLDHLADDLVTRNHFWPARRKVSIKDMEIRAAHPAGQYPDQNGSCYCAGLRTRDLLEHPAI
jgi:hypothetical protein